MITTTQPPTAGYKNLHLVQSLQQHTVFKSCAFFFFFFNLKSTRHLVTIPSDKKMYVVYLHLEFIQDVEMWDIVIPFMLDRWCRNMRPSEQLRHLVRLSAVCVKTMFKNNARKITSLKALNYLSSFIFLNWYQRAGNLKGTCRAQLA